MPRASHEGSWVDAAVDAEAAMYLSGASSLTFEAREAYLATAAKASPHHRAIFGRKITPWSQAEDQWNLGLWSPRFVWDPLAPQRIGLTGIFYQYGSRDWNLTLFGSPIAVPERGYPVREEKGRLIADSPDWLPPYEELLLLNRQTAIRYSIEQPPLSSLLLQPGAAASLTWGRDSGPWARLNGGVLPCPQLDFALEAQLNPQTSILEATLRPRILRHTLMSVESGYRFQKAQIWGSLTREIPLGRGDVPENWIVSPVGPTWISAIGASWSLGGKWALQTSGLWIEEKKPEYKADDIQINLPSRYPFRKSVQGAVRFDPNDRWGTSASWTRELSEASQKITFEGEYRGSRKSPWSFGLGVDLFSAPSGRGGQSVLSQYSQDDRVRGRVAYAF